MSNPGKTPPGELGDEEWPGFQPQEIIHAILTIKPWSPGQPLDFAIAYPDNKPQGVDVKAYALDLVANVSFQRGLTVSTQWDVGVERPCHVVLELDPKLSNWQFYGHALVSKGTDEGYDFGARWVQPDGKRVRKGRVDMPGVRVIYFSVAQRAKDGSHAYNLLVEFTDMGKVKRKLPVIFDPDVPNEGNGIFP